MFTKILTSSLLFLIALGGFFVSIENSSITSINHTNASATGITNTAATGTPTTQKPSESESKWLNEAIQAVNAILWVLTVIVSPAIILAGWLMSPDWTSGDLFGLREPMHKMWIIVSNIIYFIYAILLILIALATIFGKDNFNYKSMLPKLALGILMVPFTWWFVQWTISLATVVTASVVSIPMDMIKEDNKYINWNYIPTVYTTTTDTSGKSSTTDSAENGKCNGEIWWSGDGKCTSIQKILESGWGIYSPLLIYAYQVFRLQDYKSIEGTLNKIKTWGQLLNQLFIGAIMFIVFGLLVMALIAMLLLRAIKLWMYAIFSPIFTLHFVAGKELFGKNTEWFDIKEFIGLCFVPAVVWLSLSFGLMIISVIHNPNTQSTKCTTINITNLEDPWEWEWCRLLTLFGNKENTIIRGIYTDPKTKEKWSVNIIKIAWLTYIYKWKGTNADDLGASTDEISGWISAAGGIFWTIIVDIIALIFIWMAFMAAKGVSKAVGVAVEPFEAMGKKIGTMAMSAPKYIPIPGTGWQSAASLQRTAELASNKFDSIKREKAESQAGRLVPWATEGIVNAKDVEKMKNTIDSIKSSNSLEEKVNTMSKVTWEIQRDRKDTTANFAEIQQNLKTVFSAAADEDLKKLFLRKWVTEPKEQDALVKFYKWIEMDADERTRARNANIRFAGNSPSWNTTASGITADQIWNTNVYSITFNGWTIETDVWAKTVKNPSIDLTKITDKSLWKKDDYQKNLFDSLKQKIWEEMAKKVTDEIMSKIPNAKFTN